MSQRISSFVLIITVFLYGTLSCASEGVPTQGEIVGLLSTGQYAELNTRFMSIQGDYKNGVINDVQLRDAFRGFYFTTPSLAIHFDQWVHQFPESYVAYLARGIYYKKIGQERRGPQASSETTDEQFRGMEQAFDQASADFNRSLSLDDKPLLSFMHQINIYKLLGKGPIGRDLVERSIQIDRDNFIVRSAYMDALQSPWGGTTEQMETFLKECKKAHLSHAQLESLEALVLEDAAWTQRVGGNNAAAARLYRKEAKLNPQGNCLPCGPIHKAADALFDEKKYTQAIRLYSKVLQIDPNSVDALNRRAFSELQIKQTNEGLKDFMHSAELGNAYAQDMLGRIYLVGRVVPQDRDKAIEFLTKAASQGYQPSQELLPVALNKNAEILPAPSEPRR